MELEENTLVADRFRLVRMIGRGGMGSVWLAFDTRLDTPCAVKFIEGELANVAEAQARFEREAKAAAQLRSPHVVEIKDHGVWAGRPYIAMELLEGEDLGKALAAAGGKLAPAHVLTIIQQVTRALTKAHAAGVVHRDLKPDNIFIVNDDDRELVKILDFGVAKHASHTIDGSNTKTGAMLGTPYYMSPEQAQGIKSVDARSDLWALAVIVYQCITGRLPFESEALGDLLVKIIVQPIPVPSHVAHVPPGFDAWWAKAAERSPDNRFQTAKELTSQLELVLGASSTSAGRAPSAPHFAATAVMGPPHVTGSNPAFQSTPNPAAQAFSQNPAYVSSTPHLLVTPHPGQPTPAGMVMANVAHGASSNTAGVATFSGVEPPVMLPKKRTPIAIIGVALAIVMVGVGGATAVLSSSRAHPANADQPPTPSVDVTADVGANAAEPPPAPAPEPPPALALEPSPAVPDAPAELEPAESAATSAKPVAKPTKAPASPGPAKVQPPPSSPAKSAAPAPAKKKWDPGF